MYRKTLYIHREYTNSGSRYHHHSLLRQMAAQKKTQKIHKAQKNVLKQ